MITIHQKPQDYNYSLSLPDILIESNETKVYTRLVEVGGATIIEETYNVPPAGSRLQIKLSGLIHSILGSILPSYNDLISIDGEVMKSYRFDYKDKVSDPYTSFTFAVVKGFVRQQPFDVEALFRDNWLNMVPSHSNVWYHQPLYLTTCPRISIQVHAKAKMKDGTAKSIVLGAVDLNKIQSINLNPGIMVGKFGGEYEYFEVYSAAGDVIQCQPRRFYLVEPDYNADTFFYLNRLGGWDTIVFTGERKLKNSNASGVAMLNELQVEYNTKVGLEIEKTSGYIPTEEYRRQCIDFINSSRRFHFYEGALQPIVMTNPELEHTHGELNSFTFTFKHSDYKTAYTEMGTSSNFLSF